MHTTQNFIILLKLMELLRFAYVFPTIDMIALVILVNVMTSFALEIQPIHFEKERLE